tara:strand:+ start:392265 stop:392783 length:519 start_codon:yes stop_codon:yes gene_type:complete
VADALAQEPVGVYTDHLNDAALNSKNPPRIRLATSPDVKPGRIGGVWGTLGDDDRGDSFFVGKTPDLTNLQISMSTPPGSPSVHYVIKGTDGQDVETFSMESVPGETITHWISIKGKISVDVLATSDKPTSYALYIWYPGGSVDSLNAEEIAEISSGDFAEKPVIFRAKKGD